jgi:hypothetical protein
VLSIITYSSSASSVRSDNRLVQRPFSRAIQFWS